MQSTKAIRNLIVSFATGALVVVAGCASAPADGADGNPRDAEHVGAVESAYYVPPPGASCRDRYDKCRNTNASSDPDEDAYWQCVCKDEYCICSGGCQPQICLYPTVPW